MVIGLSRAGGSLESTQQHSIVHNVCGLNSNNWWPKIHLARPILWNLRIEDWCDLRLASCPIVGLDLMLGSLYDRVIGH